MLEAILLKLMAAKVDVPVPCSDGRCSDTELVATVLGWAYFAIAVVAVIIIIYAGVMYMISEGEPEKAKEAQRTITYTVVGLIIATAAAAIIGFVTGAFKL